MYKPIYTCTIFIYTRIHDRIGKHTDVVSKWHRHLIHMYIHIHIHTYTFA